MSRTDLTPGAPSDGPGEPVAPVLRAPAKAKGRLDCSATPAPRSRVSRVRRARAHEVIMAQLVSTILSSREPLAAKRAGLRLVEQGHACLRPARLNQRDADLAQSARLQIAVADTRASSDASRAKRSDANGSALSRRAPEQKPASGSSSKSFTTRARWPSHRRRHRRRIVASRRRLAAAGSPTQMMSPSWFCGLPRARDGIPADWRLAHPGLRFLVVDTVRELELSKLRLQDVRAYGRMNVEAGEQPPSTSSRGHQR
jgi:hypothetical protein